MSSNGFDGSAHRNPETSAQQRAVSIDHLLKLLHGESPHRLAGWLRLEDAWLFREWVHSFPGWRRWLIYVWVWVTRSLSPTHHSVPYKYCFNN